ncbi:nucleoporin Nup43 [Drosophila grimshawi]|uniref:GH18341 n=1 Tax=Drosophila grimshawi TaxID=7222 RepID=B4JF24_DROGR|nr:nucleoporin Nup43 [Drosophila grimshawi]EDV93305.1 GH18341 [Drosophila grimshawi]
MATKVAAHYISEKVSNVRWLPEQLQQTERFVTGSWDMDNNYVRLWRLHANPYAQEVQHTPRCNDKVAMDGDVTGLEFVNEDTLAVSCADGHLSLLKVHRAVEEDQLERMERSERLHEFKCSQKSAPCTAIDIYGNDIATVGEDGCVNVLSAHNLKQVKRTIDADSISLLSVCFVNQHQLVTGNRMGVIRMLDVRVDSTGQQDISFAAASQDPKNSNFVSAMATHPMQQHILICGSEEGSITVWDLRNFEYPASYLSAHNSPITDIGYHRQDPSKLFSAAEAGEVWMWSEKKQLIDMSKNDGNSAWLSGNRVRSLVNVDGVLTDIRNPVNSFDVHGSRLICGSDKEVIYIADDIF